MSLPPLDVPGLLKSFGLRPDKSLGQNFLIDTSALQRVVDCADIQPVDRVLEIGPGLGSLTRLLAQRADRVIAVELDGRLLPVLNHVLAGLVNVQIIHGDILKIDPLNWISPGTALKPAVDGAGGLEMTAGGYLVVANIPYYITSAVIRHLLEAKVKPQRMILTIQQEVAERICADPGDMSLLALSVQVYGTPGIVARIPADAFYPSPQVDSAVVRIDVHATPLFPPNELAMVFRLAKAGFSQKRKNLRNSLAGGMAWSSGDAESLLKAVGIDPSRRAETLSLEEWGLLANQVLIKPRK